MKKKICLFLILSIILLIHGLIFHNNCNLIGLSKCNYFWKYLDNQSIATFITIIFGLISIIIGYLFWEEQHKKVIIDDLLIKYSTFSIEYINLMEFYSSSLLTQDDLEVRLKEEVDAKKKDEIQKAYYNQEFQRIEKDAKKVELFSSIECHNILLKKLVDNNSTYQAIDKIHKVVIGISEHYRNLNQIKSNGNSDFNIYVTNQKDKILNLIDNLNIKHT
ncbi:hypothetical protein M0R04_01380 [Candidatus Dojkabacteria bacterium]|jgi:hypothetical protein|nr:hypothetical protein [Candidatus Dojkabacteria bacterium]